MEKIIGWAGRACGVAAFLLAAMVCCLLGACPGPALADSPEPQPMFRLYNPYTGEHFYTADADERASVRGVGWTYEGVGWVAPGAGTCVYRLYNPYAGEHHYTLSASELDALVAAGWRDEGVGWYSDDAKAVPVYREYNPNETANNHNYTTDKAEHDSLVSLGWRDEGVAWHALDADIGDPFAGEAAEDRAASLAAGMDAYTGTVRILSGRECCEQLLDKTTTQAGYGAYGHDPDGLHAVLLVDPDTTVRARSQFHGGKVVELRAGDGFGGVASPAIGLLRNGTEDVGFWRSYDGQRVTIAIDPNNATIPNGLPANCCLVNPADAVLIG